MPTQKTKKVVDHKFGCTCPYADPCNADRACLSASVEWNQVRAGFAQASALGAIADKLDELATAPLMGTDRNAISEIASAIRQGKEEA